MDPIERARLRAARRLARKNATSEDEELADFFRRAGNLKGTLKKILEGLRKPGLVYQSQARAVLRLVMQLRAGTGAEAVEQRRSENGSVSCEGPDLHARGNR